MVAPLQERPGETSAELRSPTRSDIASLATLMLRAYRGTVDDDGETAADAEAEVTKTFDGAYGPFLADCSQVVDRSSQLLSATLVTLWEDRPFIAFSMTDPDHQRTGLARACMLCALRALRMRGAHEVRLVVTVRNRPAVGLYESLGFVREE
jgi:ribosomal protein S18 acetylase RimI-like enzyme